MIIYKSAAELELMRQSGRIVGRILEELGPLVRPGIRTRDLDVYAEKPIHLTVEEGRAMVRAAQQFEKALESQDAVERLRSITERRFEPPAQGAFAQRELPGKPGDERLAGRRPARDEFERRMHVGPPRRNRWRSP